MKTETYKRLARTQNPDGTVTERPWTPHERWMLYASGFKDGAGMRPIDPKREGLGAYDRGYSDGRDAKNAAVNAYAKEVGYEPTILRLAAEPNGTPKEDV